MKIPMVKKLPQLVPQQVYRPSQDDIPDGKEQRLELKKLAVDYIAQHKPVPPISLDDLRICCDTIIKEQNVDPVYRDFLAILLNNEMWRDTLATVPYERRLLLLPKCLRVEDKCPAPFDEFGLLCKQCGLCSIQDLQNEAERLGYAVLVAEGSAIVMAMIQTGKIDAIVGVSCINVLEKAFSYMEAAAIPGVAIPLLQDDCKDTTVDLDWVWDVIHLTSDDHTYRLDLEALKVQVSKWFTPEALSDVMGSPQSQTEEIAQEWLARDGKRWRPFLTASVFKALQDDQSETPLPADLAKVAIAVECFHKASLIHDDIEDDDALRYGEKTLHEEYGVPVALNIGDYLLGEGYRLLASCDVSSEIISEMIRIASAGHRSLCLGQGTELCWTRDPQPLTSLEVLDIFSNKTAPAFEIALRLGALYAGVTDETIHDTLHTYSDSLGIAYQIRDDLEDLVEQEQWRPNKPSLLMSVVHEKSKKEQKELTTLLWKQDLTEKQIKEDIEPLLVTLDVDERCRHLLDSYKEQAIRSLTELDNPTLKGLLRRIVGKIFQVELKGWCHEFEAGDASGTAISA